MANPQRGEVELKVGAETYTLRLSNNAICTLEGLFGGEAIGEILSRLSSRTVVRAALYAALSEHHPKTTLDAVGDLMDQDAEATGNALTEAIKFAFPEAAKLAENPPIASREAG